MSTQITATDTNPPTPEHADLLESLARHRDFLRLTVRDLTDEQAAARTTVSELCLGGLIKHVTAGERGWTDFIVVGTAALPDFTAMTEDDWTRRAEQFRMLEGETLSGLLDAYAETARRTNEIVAATPDLNVSHPLPRAPWFQAGARWSARRVLLHIIAETAQHAGHADIIRESIDGARSMG